MRTQSPECFPVIMGRPITRSEIIEGLRENYAQAVLFAKQKDASFVRWPDMETILDYIDQHGLPPKQLIAEEREQEKIQYCDRAISYVLKRVREDSKVANVIGPLTESFDRLVDAKAALTGKPKEHVEAFYSGDTDTL